MYVTNEEFDTYITKVNHRFEDLTGKILTLNHKVENLTLQVEALNVRVPQLDERESQA